MIQAPVIAIKNLNHYYGRGTLKKQTLFDINLEIKSGEIVIMTGPSGSGKTTLLSLIGGKCFRFVIYAKLVNHIRSDL
jgi:putative ABC transport system ATP-binding protein